MLLWPINEHTDEVISNSEDDDIYPYFNNAITWGAPITPCDFYGATKYDTNEHAFGRNCEITTFDFHTGTMDWTGAGFGVETQL